MSRRPWPFRVWAPDRASVDLRLGGGTHPMSRREGGWFEVTVDAQPGDDYGYSLDGGDPLPDPRSAWQPHGVHGPSRLVDHASFRWTDSDWRGMPLESALLYELHVGTFSASGALDGVIERLDHLRDLGVTAVELMPLNEFPGRWGWGYDGVDLYAVRHAYGGPEGLHRLVDACHARGLAVLVDVVYNHLGPDGNHLGAFGPYFTDRHRTPWGAAVNFDGPGSDEVRRFVVDNALMWLRDYHCDGLRLDAVHAIVDTSAVHILEEIASAVDALQGEVGRTLWAIAESDLNDPRLVRSREAGGYGLRAQWSDDLHHALHTVLTGERSGYYADFGRLEHVAVALREVFVYAGTHSHFRGRRHGRSAAGLPGTRFLGYLQNHDQVGNRARGERAAALMSPGRLRIGAALVLTAPFVPLLFAGEEWGATTPFQYFSDHASPDLARAVSEGRRREFTAFGWRAEDVPDPQDPDTFARSRLRWADLDEPENAGLLEWYRSLIRLRRLRPELSRGNLDEVRTRFDEDGLWLAVDRGRLTVACNLAASPRRVPLPAQAGRVLLASAPPLELRAASAVLAAESVAIIEVAGAPSDPADAYASGSTVSLARQQYQAATVR